MARLSILKSLLILFQQRKRKLIYMLKFLLSRLCILVLKQSSETQQQLEFQHQQIIQCFSSTRVDLCGSHLSCRITQETFVEGHRCGTRAFPIFATAAASRQSLQCSYNVFIGSGNIRGFDITCKRMENPCKNWKIAFSVKTDIGAFISTKINLTIEYTY